MAHCPATSAQPLIIPADEAAAVGLTYSQQQLSPQQHVVQMVKSGQNHLGQNVFVIERSSMVTSTQEKDTTLLRRPSSQETSPQIIHLSTQQIVNSPQLIQVRRAPVKTYSPAQQPMIRKKPINKVNLLQCVQSLQSGTNQEEHSLLPQQAQTALEIEASHQTANASPQHPSQQVPQQQIVQQVQLPQVKVKPPHPIQASIAPQHQLMNVSHLQQNQQVSPSTNPEPLKQSLPRLLQRGKNAPLNIPNVSPRSVTVGTVQTVQTLTSQGVRQICPDMQEQRDVSEVAQQEQPERQVPVKPVQQKKQFQIKQQLIQVPQNQVMQTLPAQVKHPSPAQVQQVSQYQLKQKQAAQQVQPHQAKETQLAQQGKQGHPRQLLKQVAQPKLGQATPPLKFVHPAHQMKPLQSVHQLKEVQAIQQRNEVHVAQPVKLVQPLKQVQEEENCNSLSKLQLDTPEIDEGGLNMPPQTEMQDVSPPIVVSSTNATLNRGSVQTVDCSSGNKKPQVTANKVVFESKSRSVVRGKASNVKMASPTQLAQIQSQPKPVTSQSSNITNQSSAVSVPSNHSTQNVQVNHPQVTFLSFKSGQSMGHQPGNSQFRLIQTGELSKQISQIQQQPQQHQLVQLTLPHNQQLVQLAMSPQQQVIQLQSGQQISLQSSPALYQLQQSPQSQIILHAHSLPIQQQVQLQMQSPDLQAQLQAQQQAQLQAQQQVQLQAQQQAQLQAQHQAQLQQAQLQAQQQAQFQAQQQAQLQVQAQQQPESEQQAQLQAESEQHLQAQQQAQMQVQQAQILAQAHQQVQFQALQPVQLQVHQEALMHPSHSIILQGHQQPQVQAQQDEQQLHQQQTLQHGNQEELQGEQTQVGDAQLSIEQGSALFIQQSQQLHSEPATAAVSESLPQKNRNQGTNTIASNAIYHSSEVKQTKLSGNKQSPAGNSFKPPLNIYRGPPPKKLIQEKTAHVEPEQQQKLIPHLTAYSFEKQIQDLLQKMQLPAKGYATRILLGKKQENGQRPLIVQQVPEHVDQNSHMSQPQEAEQLVPPVEEEQVTVYDGVSVESEFPTGVPQECFVSESGELLFAEVCSGTDVTAGEVIQQHAEVTSKFSLTTPMTEVQEPERIKTEKPKVIPGVLALCKHCGVCSTNLNKCVRCNSVFPKEVKLIIEEEQPNLIVNPKNVERPAASFAPLENATSLLRRELILPSVKLGAKPIARTLQPLLVSAAGTEVKRKRCSTARVSKPKVPEEPEILTLSSDDEDKHEKPPKKLDAETQLLANSCASEQEAGEESRDGAAPEDSDLEETRRQSAGVAGGGMLQQVIDGSISSPFVLVSCRTVRVGTYKEKPLEKVVISMHGLELKLALPAGSVATVNIPMHDINRVLVSFCRTMPIVFIYLRSDGGAKVRETMQMTDAKSSHYYEPESSDELHKRIILLPDKITEEIKMNIKRIFENKKKIFAEISNPLANEILVKSTQHESLSRTRTGAPANEIQTLMVYPPPPAKGGISINTEDYACLGEDQFLNDVIIDFYLKYLMQSVLTEKDRERTHVFSSFFYKRLTSKPKVKGRRHPIEDDPKLSAAEKRHARVKTWTKNVNLFTKDFIIIPINESCHWFLAIICFPGQNGCLRISDNTPVDLPKPQPKPSPSAAVAAAAVAAAATTHSKLKVKDNVISIGSTTITPVKAPATSTITLDNHGDEGSDRDEAEGDEEEMAENASDDEDSGRAEDESNGAKYCSENASTGLDSGIGNTAVTPPSNSNEVPKEKKPIIREGIKQPCILIFDSLVGAPRYRVAATLREYLTIEFKVKEGKVKLFTKDTIKGMLPKVPQQTNFTDCGLYLLQYVEMFFKDPIRDYHAPIKQLVNWFSEEVVSRKREEISNLLKDLMREQNINPDSLSLPSLFSPAPATQVKAVQMTEDQEALARLAEADREAQREIAFRQLARLNKSSEPSNVVEHMQEGATYESEIEVPNNVGSTNLSETAKDGSGEDQDVLGTTLNSEEENCSKNVSLVNYDISSEESESGSKRTLHPIDNEDMIEKKKMKAE